MQRERGEERNKRESDRERSQQERYERSRKRERYRTQQLESYNKSIKGNSLSFGLPLSLSILLSAAPSLYFIFMKEEETKEMEGEAHKKMERRSD